VFCYKKDISSITAVYVDLQVDYQFYLKHCWL